MNIDFISVIDSLTVPTFVISADHTVIAWNSACENLTGIKAKDMIGTKDSWRGFYNAERPCLADLVIDSPNASLVNYYPVFGKSKFSQGLHAERWFTHINGKKRYLIFDAQPVYDDDNKLIAAVESLQDITEIKEVEEKLMLSDKVFSYTDQSILITDKNQNIIQANQSFTDLTGYSLDEVIGKNPGILASGKHDANFYEDIETSLIRTGHWEGEIWDKRKDGTIYPKWLSINTVLDADTAEISHYVSIFADISERKKNEEKVRHLAFHDGLTGLPNRMLFHDRLEHAIYEAYRNKEMVALMFIDLDRFKTINDTLGHSIGDKLLKEVALRLKHSVREADTVARLGGDEFVIILPHLSRARDVSKVANKLLGSLNHVMMLDGHEVFTSPSIGIALYPNDGLTVEALMQNADTAMYYVKDEGKNNYQFFTKEMTEASQARAKLEADLRLAIENEVFELHYQPKITLNPFKVVGCEALVRWKHPEKGYIPPDVFIPVAEELGLILPLGAWILKEAAQQISTWRNQGLEGISVAINLSPVQFRDELLATKLNDCIRISTLAPEMLELEITETILMDSIQASTESLNALQHLGVHLAIDDFGTGYSSLAYLKAFDINTLKIDKSFIDDVTTESDSREIVSAVISLAHNLNLTVVAEGVETEEQAAFLQELNCDIYQGYLFSKPLPADDFFSYVEAKKV